MSCFYICWRILARPKLSVDTVVVRLHAALHVTSGSSLCVQCGRHATNPSDQDSPCALLRWRKHRRLCQSHDPRGEKCDKRLGIVSRSLGLCDRVEGLHGHEMEVYAIIRKSQVRNRCSTLFRVQGAASSCDAFDVERIDALCPRWNYPLQLLPHFT